METMRTLKLALSIFSVFLFAASSSLAQEGTIVSHFSPGKELKGKQSVSHLDTGRDLGSRVVTLTIDKDGKTASVSMTELPVNIGAGPGRPTGPKNISARNFTSKVEEVAGATLPTIRVVDPKDGGKFTFVFRDGKVWVEGNSAGGTKKVDTPLE
ncbi:MAG: hypothetical protein AB9873_13260 [Syntrophobacteraceae bacterium]